MFPLPAFCAESRCEAVDDRARKIGGRDLAPEIGGPQVVDLRILIVEDDTSLIEGLKKALAPAGIAVDHRGADRAPSKLALPRPIH
jgi:hypothetical protein